MTTGKVSFQTVEYMQRLIAELDEANTQLRLEAADERAKIVAYIREMAERVENDPGGIAWGYLMAAALGINTEEHLKFNVVGANCDSDAT